MECLVRRYRAFARRWLRVIQGLYSTKYELNDTRAESSSVASARDMAINFNFVVRSVVTMPKHSCTSWSRPLLVFRQRREFEKSGRLSHRGGDAIFPAPQVPLKWSWGQTFFWLPPPPPAGPRRPREDLGDAPGYR